MTLFRKIAEHFISHIDCRARRKSCSQLFLQLKQFIIETVVLIIAHDLLIFLLVSTACTVQYIYQFTHMRHLICCFIFHSVFCIIIHILPILISVIYRFGESCMRL